MTNPVSLSIVSSPLKHSKMLQLARSCAANETAGIVSPSMEKGIRQLTENKLQTCFRKRLGVFGNLLRSMDLHLAQIHD